jgi:hypothetical protein
MNLTKEHFTRAATHHTRLTKSHRAIASAAEKSMSKAQKSDLKSLDLEGLDEFLQVFIETHNALGDEHAEMAEHCAKCAKAAGEAEKAVGDELRKMAPASVESYVREMIMKTVGDMVQPMGISAVAPTPPGITAVPRAGQPALPAKANVPLQFAKLVDGGDSRDSEAS